MKTVDERALESCDKEPIHIPGSIQPVGCLIAFKRESYAIKAISANCEDMLGKLAEEMLDKPLEALLTGKPCMPSRTSLLIQPSHHAANMWVQSTGRIDLNCLIYLCMQGRALIIWR